MRFYDLICMRAGPNFTFQYVLLNPYQTNFFFLYFYTSLKGPFSNYVTLKNVFFNLTHPYVTLPNKGFVINASRQTYVHISRDLFSLD